MVLTLITYKHKEGVKLSWKKIVTIVLLTVKDDQSGYKWETYMVPKQNLTDKYIV